MPVDWRALFNSISVDWRDRGKNTSRGNITIRCPWCGSSDYSGHLKIAEEVDGFFCLRNARHAGSNMLYLLTALGLPRPRAIALYNSYMVAAPKAQPSKEARPHKLVNDQWHKFRLASLDDRYLQYLERRGWRHPEEVMQRYDLRYAPVGQWACRLLVPLPDMYDVEAWTGRTIIAGTEPKYRMMTAAGEGIVYQPRGVRSLLYIVEGPMDALKIASATENCDCAAIALTGKSINAERRLRIKYAAEHARRVVVSLDSDTGRAESNLIYAALRSLLPDAELSLRRMPDGYKDAGEVPMPQLREWAMRP